MIGAPINDLFCISDLHIGKSGCSTIPESYIYGLPNIEFKPQDEYTKTVVSKDHSNLALFNVNSVDELEYTIKDITEGKFPERVKNHRDQIMREYITNYFHKIDGKRCASYAKKINKILVQEEKLEFFTNFKKIFFRFLNFLKDFGNKHLRIVLKKYYVDTLIDKRGRYDSRINLNDEYNYYKTFDILKFNRDIDE